MAAQTTDRLWSSTQVLGAHHDQMNAAAAAAAAHGREAGRCRCCPYGYHIDIDFLDYLNTIKAGAGLSKLKKIHGHRLRQRQAMESRLLMIRPPPAAQRPGVDGGWTDPSESSGSSSPVTPRSQSEDERDVATTAAASSQLMADLDASIADALDSIEALMQPRRSRAATSGSETVAVTGSRLVSAGDVRRYPGIVDAQTSASSTVIAELPRDPPSPLSSFSCSLLQDDNRQATEVFPATSAQPLSVDGCLGNNKSFMPFSDVDLRQQTEITSVSSTTTVLHESPNLPAPSSHVPVPDGKSRGPPPPVKPRHATGMGVGKGRSRDDTTQEVHTITVSVRTADSAGSGALRRLPAVPMQSAVEIPRSRDFVVDERHVAAPHSTTSDSTTHVYTTSATTTTGSTDIFTSGRQLPVPPKPPERETSSANATKESSFSSVRALLNRKSGGTQRIGASKVDRPVRRSRHSVTEAVETRTSCDVTSAPARLLQSEAASESDRGKTETEHRLQADENDSTAATATTSTVSQVVTEAEVSSCFSPVDVEATQPQSSLSRDQVDDRMQVSFEELTKAMAMLSSVDEERQDTDDVVKLDRGTASSSAAAVNPDVLLTIRKYIASSLQQMRMMEQQVKLVPVLQLRVSVLKEEKRLLKLQLQSARNDDSTAKATLSDACVAVTPSQLPVADNDRLQLPVERRDVGVGDWCVEIISDPMLYCHTCKTALRRQPPQSSNSLESTSEPEEEEIASVQKSELEPETVVMLHGQGKNNSLSTRRLWLAEKTVHAVTKIAADDVEISAVSDRALATEPSAATAARRPKPPVPHKEISVRREKEKNQSTVGIQCTLLKDSTEHPGDTTPEILTSERVVLERADFRAQEPDLVTTHCLGGTSQNGRQVRSDVPYPLKTFSDKETGTDRTSLRSAAVNTDAVQETPFKFSYVDARIPSAQMTDCAVNTDISGSLWSAAGDYSTSVTTAAEHVTISKSVHTKLDVSSEPEFHDEMKQQTMVTSAVGLGSEDATNSALNPEAIQFPSALTVSQDAVRLVDTNALRSFKDASCSVDIITKPVTTDAASCTDDSLLSTLIFDASKLKSAAEARPVVKDVECSADLTMKPSVVTTACNTEASVDQLLTSVRETGCNTDAVVQPVMKDIGVRTEDASDARRSDVTEAWCQTDVEKKPTTCEVVCEPIELVESVVSNLIDVACGDDETRASVTASVQDVSCNTEVKTMVDAWCSVTEEQRSVKDISCSVDIKLSVCDQSCSTEFGGATVEWSADGKSVETASGKDSACMTDSLTTSEASSNTNELMIESSQFVSSSLSAGARLSVVEAACLTDKPSSREMGCSTDDVASFVETTSLPKAEDAPALKPALASVETSTDAWLLTSDIAFFNNLKEILKPSVTETASVTEKLQTSDASTSSTDDFLKGHASDRSTNTDAEAKRALVDAESLVRPAVCEVGCNTDAEDKRRQVRNAASSTDVDLRPSVSDVSVSTDATVETLSWKPSCSVASNTNTTIHPFATASVSSSLLSGSVDALPHLKDAASATDSPSTRHASVNTSKPLSVDAATDPTSSTASESRSESGRSDASCGADTVQQRDEEVTAKADTAEVACGVSLKPSLRSVACCVDAEVVRDDSSSDAPVFRDTRHVACNTEKTLTSWWLDDPSRFSTDVAALEDDSAISAVYWTNDEGCAACRFCGIQRAAKTTEINATSVADILPPTVELAAESKRTEEPLSDEAGFVGDSLRANEHFGVRKIVVPDESMVDDAAATEWRRVDAAHTTKDVGCDTERILTADAAMNTDSNVELLEAKQETEALTVRGAESLLGVGLHASFTKDTTSITDSFQQPESVRARTAEKVACGTSGMDKEVRESDNVSVMLDTAVQSKSVAETFVVQDAHAVADSESVVTGCPTCLAKPPTRDSSCGNDSPSLSDEFVHPGSPDRVEFAVPSRTVCEVGCNTDWSRSVPTTAEAECSTSTVTCDVGSNTDVVDVARKPTRIPQKLAATTGQPVARPVVKDAFCITDIAITPSEDDAVLKKTEDRELPRAVRSTSEVACGTDAIDLVATSASDGVEMRRPPVREVGCGADLTSRTSTREAGCTASPQTKSRSCGTDPVLSQPATETPVKAERTRTGLQAARKTTKRQSGFTATAVSRSTDTLTSQTTQDAPLIADVVKSPTVDVACGTDLEFHSKYFDVDDGGLLRQLSADDVVEILRRRSDASSSVTSPTCEVACNTEHDSRPCTPARVNYSRYYALAAVEPPPPTAIDVACGPDSPSTTLCDVGCGTELPASPFQTSPYAVVTTRDGRGKSKSSTVSESTTHRRTEEHVLRSVAKDERQSTSHGQTEVEQVGPREMVDASVVTDLPPPSQDQACDTSDLPGTIHCQTFKLSTADTKPEMDLVASVSNQGIKQKPHIPDTTAGRDVCGDEFSAASTTSTYVVREEVVSRSRTAIGGSASHSSTANRPSHLDVGRADEQTERRHEDFNNNDDDDVRQSGEFQTDSLRTFGLNEEPDRLTRPVIEGEGDVKYIDDDYDSELDGVDQKELEGRSTTSVSTSDEDVGAASTAADLGRRWGTIDLLKPSPISPLPSPGAVPLKSIMKSPKPSAEEPQLFKTKKGISFSHDTIFKEAGSEDNDDDDDEENDRRLASDAAAATSSHQTTPSIETETRDDLTSACETYALWLRDSTEVTSKQLNRSLQTIRQKWFLLTTEKSSDMSQLQSFLDELNTFSPELLKNVINLADDNGNSALHYAMSNGQFEMVKLLLDTRKCDISRQNKTGCTVVMLASLVQLQTDSDRDVIRRLFQLGDINQQASLAGQTALMLASSRGREDVVAMLLEAGADVNAQDDDGSTALMCAAEHGCIDVVKMLLAHPDCDPTLQDNDGSTAMSVAMEAGNRDVGVLLYSQAERLKSSSGKRRHKRKSPTLKFSKS